MMIAQISIFDWNSRQEEQMQEDAARFHFKARKVEEDMGFITYEIEGSQTGIDMFLDFYELQLDTIIQH